MQNILEDTDDTEAGETQDRKHHKVPKIDNVLQQKATEEELKDERRIL